MIQPSDLFHTPEDWDELGDWIERHPPEDRLHLWTAAFMSWNLACKIVDKHISKHLPPESENIENV